MKCGLAPGEFALKKIELLKNVYQAIDWAALYKTAPGIGRNEVDSLFREMREALMRTTESTVLPRESSENRPAAESAVLYCDGASRGNPGPASIGFVIESPDGIELAARGERIEETTNNVAEYTALLKGLREAIRMGVRNIEILTDSQLMARQLNGRYKVKSIALKPLFQETTELLGRFDHWTLRHIERQSNTKADQLASSCFKSKKQKKP